MTPTDYKAIREALENERVGSLMQLQTLDQHEIAKERQASERYRLRKFESALAALDKYRPKDEK